MDWLLEIENELAQQVYWQVATLLDLEVDLFFFDTTSTYFELDQADTPVRRDTRGYPVDDHPDSDDPADPHPATGSSDTGTAGFRGYGHSTDHRPDLPQVVVGMAVTRTGIPVRCWSWPGNTTDSALIRQVRDDLRDWKLSRVVWVADRGFTSAENRRYLQRGGGHYILGEKLRPGSAEATASLSRQARYQQGQQLQDRVEGPSEGAVVGGVDRPVVHLGALCGGPVPALPGGYRLPGVQRGGMAQLCPVAQRGRDV